jgi:hypothetical protein
VQRRQIGRGAPRTHDWIVALVDLLDGVSILCALESRTGSGVAFSNTSPRARVHRNECKKPHRGERRWGVQKQAFHTAAYFITNPTDYPLKCRGFPGSLRWEVNVSARRGAASSSQFNRDGEERISDTRVLCVVVVTQRGITVFVDVETRARPVHSRVRLTGVRRPARISAR